MSDKGDRILASVCGGGMLGSGFGFGWGIAGMVFGLFVALRWAPQTKGKDE